MTIDDLIDQYYTLGTRSQGGKIAIKHVMDRPLMTILFTFKKVARSRVFHQTTISHMINALECMAPTIFNWCGGDFSRLEISTDNMSKGRVKTICLCCYCSILLP